LSAVRPLHLAKQQLRYVCGTPPYAAALCMQ
jgi:hypothetical protein